MQQRLPSLLDPPIMFAHRGARAHAPDNTLEAFELALRLGATGLESDVWVTADGVPVLDHDGEVRVGRFRKRPIGAMRRDELPEHIPTLADLLAVSDDRIHLSLDLKDPDSGPATVEAVAAHHATRLERLWLCTPDLPTLRELRALDERVRLVNSTRLHAIDEGPERRAAVLAADRIDGINLRNQDWNGGLVALFHRFERIAFAWDLQFEHHLRPAFRMGIDAVYSDHVDRMLDSFRSEIGSPDTQPD